MTADPQFRAPPPPMGVRAAAIKMAMVVAETDKPGPLTPDERKVVTAVGAFFAQEYERISADNDRLAAELLDARDRLARVARIVAG